MGNDKGMEKMFEKVGNNDESVSFMKKLSKGFDKFLKEFYIDQHIMQRLATEGQTPKAIFLGCMDARAVLADIFDLKPNDVFVVKGIGNIHPKYDTNDSASIKFHAELSLALDHYKVEDLFTTSHTKCGAAGLLAADSEDEPRIMAWLKIVGKELLQKAKDSLPDDVSVGTLAPAVEKHIVKSNYHRLLEYPCVQEALAENRLNIHPWLFDMKNGRILEYNVENNNFDVVSGFDLSELEDDIEQSACCKDDNHPEGHDV